ncbi:hypothetical protein MMC14_004342 [Varicellaria rhodocarpa]|nr:hypothetical protein [Varicellaria rhodocarpa]
MPALVAKKSQTSRQAKKAYRASSGPKFSDSELRKFERAGELRERAERIREKETRKQLNKKKKAEKEQKEKAAKKRQGICEEEEKISPRQVRIGVFLGKRKREDNEETGRVLCERSGKVAGAEKEEPDKREDDEEIGTILHERSSEVAQPEKEEQKPKRRPLQEIDGNMIGEKTVGREAEECPENPSSNPKSAIRPPEDDDWSFFLDSNTQIEREISTPNRDAPHTLYLPPKQALSLLRNTFAKEHKEIRPVVPAFIQALKPLEDPFLASDFPFISTQDLNFTDDDDVDDHLEPQISKSTTSVAQNLSTQDLNFTNDVDLRLQASTSALSAPQIVSDFLISTQDFDFTEEDLQDLGVASPLVQRASKKTEPSQGVRTGG